MPYRDELSGEPCHRCDRPAVSRCPCCTRPTCTRHLPEGQKMCGNCDEAYYRFINREDSRGTLLPVVVVTALASVTAMISMSLLPVTVGLVFVGFPGVMVYLKARDRRKFFQQMATRGAIAEKPSDHEPSEEDRRLAEFDRKLEDRRALSFQASFEDEPVEPPT